MNSPCSYTTSNFKNASKVSVIYMVRQRSQGLYIISSCRNILPPSFIFIFFSKPTCCVIVIFSNKTRMLCYQTISPSISKYRFLYQIWCLSENFWCQGLDLHQRKWAAAHCLITRPPWHSMVLSFKTDSQINRKLYGWCGIQEIRNQHPLPPYRGSIRERE